MSAFFSSELWPFALAAAMLIAVAAVESLTVLVGTSASQWLGGPLDHSADVGGEPDGWLGAVLGWLHVGKVPVLAILVIFLTMFAVIGFAAQLVARSMIGHSMPLVLAVPVAFVAGCLAVRVVGGAIGRLIPKDETSAVPDASLVGRVGTIVIGTAKAGRPAEARIRDEHGTTHYIMVEPEHADEQFDSGARVLLVRHLSGRRFHAIHNPKPELL